MAIKRKTKIKETPEAPPAMTSDEATAKAIQLKFKELHDLIGATSDHSLFAACVHPKGMHHVMAGTATNQIGAAVLGLVRVVQGFIAHEEENDNPLIQALKQSLVRSMATPVNDKDKN